MRKSIDPALKDEAIKYLKPIKLKSLLEGLGVHFHLDHSGKISQSFDRAEYKKSLLELDSNRPFKMSF